MLLDCKLGSRTYHPSEPGLDDIHRPDLLAKLEAALPDAVQPEYAKHFTKKTFADIRAVKSTSASLSFRISVSDAKVLL